GRVAAAVTEKGRIACDSVVLAGGAWSRLFCGNFGLPLPQLKVRTSVVRTEPLEGGPETAAWGPGFGFRKRFDGGYTDGNSAFSVADVVPDSFRLFFDFLPGLRLQHKSFKIRVGRRFVEEWRLPRKWSLDGASPFESVRTLDPEPAEDLNEEARVKLVQT